ncbi:hypothetical protein A6V37_30435 [Paraburkholderia ginsengiterrae]|uniref:Uncharacterized protein n=1 Tax=Paraburkholderia ginsengiterrae TaxID=1462993 RepID=A0A1A9N323_9BURK|nr:hypothetical protein A6V37_30435 [Paraburkholderia ginsengiterrae]
MRWLITRAAPAAAPDARQVVDAFFDVAVRHVRIDSVVSVGVRHDFDFRSEKAHSAECKQRPDAIACVDRLDDLFHLDNLEGGQPFIGFWIDVGPAQVGNAVGNGVNAYAIDCKRSHVELHRPYLRN